MAASIKRAIRRSLVEIIQGTTATPAEQLEACRLLWKEVNSAQKGKPRGRPFQKRPGLGITKTPKERIDALE
jgi:hypothetical protein